MSLNVAIELQSVGIRRDERWLVRNVSWSVAASSCAAILGPNGCGKSTLARIVSGYLWPTEGRVAVNGSRYGETDVRHVRRGIRLVQAAGPFDVDPQLTGLDVVLTGFFGTIGLFDPVSVEQRARGEMLLKKVGLAKLSDRTYATMSSGERVRALIARALVDRPPLLLLDEPTAGLDLLAREQVLAAVQSLFDEHSATAVVMITHHVEELPPATSNVLLMKEGSTVKSGTPAEVLTSEMLSEIYECPVTVTESGGRRYAQVSPEAWGGLL